MGWEDYHLRHFETSDRRYGIPDPMWPESGMTAAKNVKLVTLIDRVCGSSPTPTTWVTTGGTPSRSRRSARRTRRQISALRQWRPALPARGCRRLSRLRDVPRRHGRPRHEEHDALREWQWRPVQTPTTSTNASPAAPSRPSPSAATRQTGLPEEPRSITRRYTGHAYHPSSRTATADTIVGNARRYMGSHQSASTKLSDSARLSRKRCTRGGPAARRSRATGLCSMRRDGTGGVIGSAVNVISLHGVVFLMSSGSRSVSPSSSSIRSISRSVIRASSARGREGMVASTA